MKTEATDTGMVKPYVRHPYAFLALEEVDVSPLSRPTVAQKRAYLRKLQNPYATLDIFGEPEEQVAKHTAHQQTFELEPVSEPHADKLQTRRIPTVSSVETALDEVLDFYKPFVADEKWPTVMAHRESFLREAKRSPENAEKIASRLLALKFPFLPKEVIVTNSASVDAIKAELDRVLQ